MINYFVMIIVVISLGIFLFKTSKIMKPLWFCASAVGVKSNDNKQNLSASNGRTNKILHIVSSLDAGGVEILLYTYYSHMNRDLFKFDFVITNDDPAAIGICSDYFKELGCEIFVLPSKKHFIQYHSRLKKIIKNGNYDAIHVHQDEMSFQSLLCAKQCKLKVRIAHAHHNHKSKSLKFKIFSKLTNRYCTQRFACSHEAGVSLFGDKEFFIMKNAIDVKKFLFNATKRTKLRNQYHLGDQLVIGTVARMTEQKNPKFAIEVMAEVMRKNDNIVYVWVGDGDLYPQIEKLVQEKNLQDRIFLLGKQFNAADFYNMFDVFFLPSKEEGLGISAVEAQYNGLPCVLSTGFPAEVSLVENNVISLDVKQNIDDWVDVLISSSKNVLSNRKLTNQEVLESYAIDKCVKKLENKYREINL